MITAFRKEIRLLISILFVSLVLISCSKYDNIDSLPPDPSEFIDYSIDGANYSYNGPSDIIGSNIPGPAESQTFNQNLLRVHSSGQQDANYSVLMFNRNGMAVNSNQPLHLFGTTNIFTAYNALLSQTPAYVHITEYGQVGEYIAGEFQGILFESAHQSITHNVSVSFRVKRTF